jgi:hypothetical protein
MPRSRSTALLKSMNSNQHIDECMFEPFLDGFNQTRSYDDIIDEIQRKPVDRNVFIKEICNYIPLQLSYEFYRNKVHTFLLRDPVEIVKSYIYLCRKTNHIIDYDKEMRFDKFYDLFCYVTQVLGHKPIVIDSEDLVSNPREVLESYCQQIGIPYSNEMLDFKELGIDASRFNNEWIQTSVKTHTFSNNATNTQQYSSLKLTDQELAIIDLGKQVYKKIKNQSFTPLNI